MKVIYTGTKLNIKDPNLKKVSALKFAQIKLFKLIIVGFHAPFLFSLTL